MEATDACIGRWFWYGDKTVLEVTEVRAPDVLYGRVVISAYHQEGEMFAFQTQYAAPFAEGPKF